MRERGTGKEGDWRETGGLYERRDSAARKRNTGEERRREGKIEKRERK